MTHGSIQHIPVTTRALSIVIPAHNEELRLEPTVQAYVAHFGSETEFIIVPNGCTDQTLAVAERLRTTLGASITVLNFPEAIGKGGAIIEGFRRASGNVVGFVDADGATTPAEYERLAKMVGSYDVVFGSRWMRGATVYNRSSLLRKAASMVFVVCVKALFRLPYHDTQCGCKLFSRRAIDAILPALTTHDSAIDVELLIRSRAAGMKVHEEPTIWTDNDSSVYTTSKFSFVKTSIRMFRSLIRLRFHAS